MSRFILSFCILISTCIAIGHSAEYLVNVYADLGDLNPGDGICQCDGFYNCSLRAALEEANLDGEHSTIQFAIPLYGVESIWAANLPGLLEPTLIDASNMWQGSWPEGRPGVELRGNNLTTGMMSIAADNCSIYGLIFSGVDNRGIHVVSGSGSIIGGTSPGQRNIFTNGGPGIHIDYQTYNLTISGNYFGTYDGMTPHTPATGFTGILDSGSGTQITANVIGGYSSGIAMHGSSGRVIGNTIGISIDHTVALPNNCGIQLGGGAELVESNVIAGNSHHGIDCFQDLNTIIRSNTIGSEYIDVVNGEDGIYVGISHDLQILDNLISRNLGNGILGSSMHNCTISRNIISRNHRSGINLVGSSNTIGISNFEISNQIHSNLEHGIHLHGAPGVVETTGNVIQNNTIGLIPTSSMDLGNGMNGILLDDAAHDNMIGGESAGNWIGWNNIDGIALTGANVTGNDVIGNTIGVTYGLGFEAPNAHHGISVYDGAAGNTIGSVQGIGNRIFASGWSGIAVVGADYNAIISNEIGISPDFSSGNSFYGIHVNGASATQILLNHISLNGTNAGEAAIRIQGSTATGNTISINSIHDHAGPAIELIDQGNGNLAAPVITAASSTHVEGTSFSGCVIELFSDYGDEGRQYEATVGCNPAGFFQIDRACQGPFITATSTDGSMNTSPFSAPAPISPLGMTLEMPSHFFSKSDPCYLRAHIRNDQFRSGVPIAVILDVMGNYWFWPGWSTQYDESIRDIAAGSSQIDIIASFVWPDTGYDSTSNIVFWGAMLTPGRDEVLGGNGGIGQWTFGYGP